MSAKTMRAETNRVDLQRRPAWAAPGTGTLRRTTVAVSLVVLVGAATSSCSCGTDTEDATSGTLGAGGMNAGGAGGSLSNGVNVGGNGGAGGLVPSDLCGTDVPNCVAQPVGPTSDPSSPFPLPPDPGVTADGVVVDEDGYIGLDSTTSQSDFLWVADDMNYGVGFVSKIGTNPFPDPPIYREVARYVTVTCQSDPVLGNKEGVVLGQNPLPALCADGINGCCARDESVPGPGGGHTPVNLFANRPSRTSVDFNGDMWVANRAFGRQQSVTKIAGDPARCIDRNNNGMIDTSTDVNSDGIITTDCDNNNLPDDLATACTAGFAHEFFGLDDECILFTVNYGSPDEYGRPLTLSPSELNVFPPPPSDAWAGTYNNGTFYRIDGTTGQITNTVAIAPQNGVASNPYGAVVDRYGILWAPNIGQSNLFYFDTKDPTQQGMVTNNTGGPGFYGIAVDGFVVPGETSQRQQIWLGEVGGSGAYRYRPVRDQGFAGLALGTWARGEFEGGGAVTQGRGIGVDNRQPTSFAWVALDSGAIGRIPTDIPDNVTMLIAADNVFPTGQAGTLGAGVASNLDIWGINQGPSSATHFAVDPAGQIVGGPDTVPLDDKPGSPDNFCGSAQCKPHPYTYSDFTGFGLINFTNPKGFYTYILEGCAAGQFTRWYAVEWDSDEPLGTDITVAARSADTPGGLATATYTGEYTDSPADLMVAPGPLVPNPARYIQVQFVLTTENESSPKLKGFYIAFACESDVPD
jgi:hypothetical protein